MLATIGPLALLCLLPRTDASVQTEKSIVLDYLDVPAGSQFAGNCKEKCSVYATGYANAGNLLSNIYIKVGTQAEKTTVADLAIPANNEQTGLKNSLKIAANMNYTITNENPQGSNVTTFYIYISSDTSPIVVIDASKGSMIISDRPVLVMSPFPLLTLHSFDTGKSAILILSVAAPDSQSTFLNVRALSAKKSVVKIFGPIATLKPTLTGSPFSFIVDSQKECDWPIEPGAVIAFSSPGNAGQTNDIYSHVLASEGVSCFFSTRRSSDIMTDVIATFNNVSDTAISFIDKDNHLSVAINLDSKIDTGVVETKGYARDIKLLMGGSHGDLNMLEVIFTADNEDERVDTSTSLPTTTTRITSLPPTTSDSFSISLIHGIILLVVIPVLLPGSLM